MSRSRNTIVLFVALAAAIVFAVLIRMNRPSPDRGVSDADTSAVTAQPNPADAGVPGRWRLARDTGNGMSDEEARRVVELHALPYLQGSKPAPTRSSVTVYDPDRAYDGFNLYNSGHFPSASLIDMSGEEVHRWELQAEVVWPGTPPRTSNMYWRRVHLMPKGELLVLFDNHGIVKLDKDSKVIWAVKGLYHHDIEITDGGTIYLLDHRPEPARDMRSRLADNVVVLDSTGKFLWELPILTCLRNSPYRHLLKLIPARERDPLHTNSIRVFDGSLEHISPHYERGNILVSMRHINAVAILDPEEKTAVWALAGGENGMFAGQHDPTVLPNGNMLIFDNHGHNGKSKILEFKPETLETAWIFADSPKFAFHSQTMGAVSRLPNGNTLVSESDAGRAFEVTPNKELVWEFSNPHRAGDNDEFVATVFEMQRIATGFAAWLE